MISLGSATAILGVIISYLLLKNQTLKSSGQIQTEIETRLQPRYTVKEPWNTKIAPHTDWPSEEIYFSAWHVEVYEDRWGTWKKWLPRGSFDGTTIVTYEIHGTDLPSQEAMQQHGAAQQKYVQNLCMNAHEPQKVEVVYNSVSPSNISRFATEFENLLRDTIYRELNPDTNLQYELVKTEDNRKHARLYDANKESS
jgi:hypothetical protein